MFSFKRFSKDELEYVIHNASVETGIAEVVIEKDYWVSFVLNYLFSQCEWSEYFTFKGGTSLSKCFGLIERFSEDIDLILDWRLLGYSNSEPWEERSKNQQVKFNEQVNKQTAEFLVQYFVPRMTLDFKNYILDDFAVDLDDEDPQTVVFTYPSNYESFYIAQNVRMEIGSLAAWTPAKIIGIQPDIKSVYPQLFEGENIDVRTVLPERTFWEKATILHHEAHRPENSKLPDRYARHYYDMYCLAKSTYKAKAFADKELLEKVVRFKEKFYPRGWARYEEAVPKTIRLVPDAYRLKEIKADYNSMEEMFFCKIPEFDEIIQGLADLEKEIHSLK